MELPQASPADVQITPHALDHAWQTLVQAADDHAYGGAVVTIVRHGHVVFQRATGWAVREPDTQRSPMQPDTIFDLASLTKVVATTPAILQLVDRGDVVLDAPLSLYIPEFGDAGDKADVTIRRLLAHTSGITAWRPVYREATGPAAYVASLAADQPATTPGSRVEYSCMGFILLHEVLRRVSGETIDSYARRHVFVPLGMHDTMFTPPASLRDRIAATELGNESEVDAQTPLAKGLAPRTWLLRGEVHDGNAWYGFGGVSGNAGLFGTAHDLVIYGQMWLNGGQLGGTRLLSEQIVRDAITEQTGLAAPNDRRGLGWQMSPHRDDTSAPGHAGWGLSPSAFGHTGFTGTALWMDPQRDLIIAMLTNRVHPTVNAAYIPIRRAFISAVAEACT